MGVEVSDTTLHFSRSLYSPAAIRETAEAYGSLATWSVSEDEHTVTVTMTGATDEIDHLADHFANHALHLSIATVRRSAEGAQ